MKAKLITTIDRSQEELYGVEAGANYVEIFRVLKTLVYEDEETKEISQVHILDNPFIQPVEDIYKLGEVLKFAHEEIHRLRFTTRGKHEFSITIDGVDFYKAIDKKTAT